MSEPKRYILPAIILAGLLAGCAGAAAVAPTATLIPATVVPATPAPTLQEVVNTRLHWFETSAILYHGSKIIYFDPVNLAGTLPKADIILISHGHSDHWSIPDIQKIIGPDTVLVVSPNIAPESLDPYPALGIKMIVVKEWETIDVNGISIQGVPAFDIHHARETGGLGFVVAIDGIRMYFAGGTGFYPEMSKIESDISIYPMYRKDDVAQALGVLPTRLMILVHTSSQGAASFAKIFSESQSKIAFATLDPGPYQP
jgi:L-ascorbate metabolism protein UlaG (beta-lactamase superfamily)